ncbi:flagellar basal body L-ring protein FlgH [Selenomonas ruminantium]|uniref:Flagellar L-ring protein FlgH n=1 Tax=Selenomonas ruminantium TaxID=971 RepID=A0A1H3XSF9_SELRU|nr:flagellar basal body L-ring protein FlgH [Selenomonas ruminantium]SEA02427.1 flagellar L-ring protein precursor FlgH [Selenomonas ruminantium]
MKNTYKRQIALALAAGGLFYALAPATVDAQSLWAADGGKIRSVFADRKAQDVGDILTIVISESTSISDTRSTSNSKSGKSSVNAGIGIFDFIKAASIGGSDSFNADGEASSKNTTRANVTVTVVDVQPNGNLVLEGTQSIWNNKNEHKITFKGICRPEDVTANNTISSTKIAGATVRFDGKGPLNAKQRQGILTQIFNFLF